MWYMCYGNRRLDYIAFDLSLFRSFWHWFLHTDGKWTIWNVGPWWNWAGWEISGERETVLPGNSHNTDLQCLKRGIYHGFMFLSRKYTIVSYPSGVCQWFLFGNWIFSECVLNINVTLQNLRHSQAQVGKSTKGLEFYIYD